MQLVAYLRVSTKQQGEEGFGLAAQQTVVSRYAESIGAKIIATYTEVESGRKTDRPELHKALAHAKRAKARLVIAKLDRLARNVAFISRLMEANADFVACDVPSATPLTLHILAAVAEEEARLISARTKAGLAETKRAGTLLGSARPGHWTGRESARLAGSRKGGAARRERAMRASARAREVAARARAEGLTLDQVAVRLVDEGLTPPMGANWSRSQVLRLLR